MATYREPLLPDGSRGKLASLTKLLHAPSWVSMSLAVVIIGLMCGVVAFFYDSILDAFLTLTWEVVPEALVVPVWKRAADAFIWWPSSQWILAVYIVLISTLYGGLSGCTQTILGCPGDLPETIGSFHKQGFVNFSQAPSMLFCSLFGVCGGGSLGPEAPLLTLCASSVSYLFQKIIPVSASMMRYCSLLAMAGGLAAFFGVGLGGALFALEVHHRMGMEYFEASTYAIGAGLACLAVFRALANTPFGELWWFPGQMIQPKAEDVVVGAVMGAFAAAVAIVWILFTKAVKRSSCKMGLDEHKRPILCGILGGLLVGILGALLPPTLFWGEFEMKTLADDRIPLPHIWPKGGVWGIHPFLQGHYTAGIYALIGVVKLLAITITLVAGFRGGFIFPLFSVGTAIGTSMSMLMASWMPSLAFPPVLLGMTFAAGINTSITRTPIGTPLILTTLCGQPQVAAPCIASAYVALLLTRSFPFMMTQQSRADFTTPLSENQEPRGIPPSAESSRSGFAIEECEVYSTSSTA